MFAPVVKLVDEETLPCPMSNRDYKIMPGNVRVLNSPAKHEAVAEVAATNRIAIIALQETKLESLTTTIAREIGGARLNGCAVLPAIGTRGGATIFWDKQVMTVATHAVHRFSLTVKVSPNPSDDFFWLTMVYDLMDSGTKEDFLRELAASTLPQGEPWLISGDFNMIYEARDKNNSNLNRRIMGRFRKAIDMAGLREIRSKNRYFTWSSERENPTLCNIDKYFCNMDWEAMHPSFLLSAASTSFSDHCPLLLSNAEAPPCQARF